MRLEQGKEEKLTTGDTNREDHTGDDNQQRQQEEEAEPHTMLCEEDNSQDVLCTNAVRLTFFQK